MRLQRTAWTRFEDFSPKPSQTLERGREGFQGDVCSDSGSGAGRLRRGPCCLAARGQMACTERVTAAVTEPHKNRVLPPFPPPPRVSGHRYGNPAQAVLAVTGLSCVFSLLASKLTNHSFLCGDQLSLLGPRLGR